MYIFLHWVVGSAQKRYGLLGVLFWRPGGKKSPQLLALLLRGRGCFGFWDVVRNGRELGKREHEFVFRLESFVYFFAVYYTHCSLTDDAIKVGERVYDGMKDTWLWNIRGS